MGSEPPALPSDPEGPGRDVAEQNTRTTLAWRRTNLAALAVAALAAKAAPGPAVAFVVFGLAFGICAVVGWSADRRRVTRMNVIEDWDAGTLDPGSSVAASAAVASATGLTVGIAAIGVLIVLAR